MGSVLGEFGYDQAAEVAEVVRQRVSRPIRAAVVLGTGLGGLADRVTDAITFPYSELPHFPHATVVGHAGRLVFGDLRGMAVGVMQGRFHLYEGYSPSQVVFPLRVLQLLGADTLIVTNASGGMTPSLVAGSLLLLKDHIGLPTMAGLNPLRGPNDERFGPRFPSISGAYDSGLRSLAKDVAKSHRIRLHEGVYAMVSGPNYESPAELRFLRQAGADAVGMSTVPEVLAARHMGMRVLAISCVTNATIQDESSGAETAHEDVVAVAQAAGERLATVIEDVLARLAQGA